MTDQSGSGGAWHPDPLNRYSQRWWDGSTWTDQVIDATGATITDPMGVTAAPAVDATIVDPVAEPGTTAVFGAPPPPGTGPAGVTGTGGYGAAPTAGYVAPAYAAKSTNGLAIAALILGVGSLFFCWIPFLGLVCLPFALGGVVCGFLGISAAKKSGSGKGMAVAGLVTGVVAIVFAVAITAAVALWVDDATDGIRTDLNSDPSDGVCNPDRFWQDPDC